MFVHKQALVEEGTKIGEDTRIWAFTHILPGAVIGRDCNICDYVFVENDVILGDRVTIKSGVQIWDGVILEDEVFVGPNATFTNDLFPRSKQYPAQFVKTIVRKGASIGANATILAGVVIGVNAMVGAGSVVTKDVPPNAIVVGNPAHIQGYVDSTSKDSLKSSTKTVRSFGPTSVSGVELYEMPVIEDMRGDLSVGEYGKNLPFVPKRYFIVFNVPGKNVRGEHAHKDLHQFLVCVKGSCSVVVDDGSHREEILLSGPEVGIYIPPMVWAIQYRYSSDAVLLVLASDLYDPNDYIRDYDQFLAAVKR